jgi:hypothetical protein
MGEGRGKSDFSEITWQFGSNRGIQVVDRDRRTKKKKSRVPTPLTRQSVIFESHML